MGLKQLSIRMSLVLVLGMTMLSIAGPRPADAAAVNCRTPWGSLPKEATATRSNPTHLVNLRAGRHDCFDRLVVDFDGESPSYSIRYVDAVIEDGRGREVPLRGGASMEIRVFAPAHDDAGSPTYKPTDRTEAVPVGGYQTFRQVHFVGTFEGETQIGLGLRARLPFRVFALNGPGNGSRLVIDVAHRWDPPPTTVDKPEPVVKVYFTTGDGTDCAEVTGYDRNAAGEIALIGFALDQLVAGPTDEEKSLGASSWFSPATAGSVRSINLKSDGLLIVDLRDIRSTISGASSSCGSAALLANLNTTVFEFAAVDRVRYQINGSCDTFFNWLQRSCTIIER